MVTRHPSAAGPVQTSESSPVRDQRSTTEQLHRQLTYLTYIFRHGRSQRGPGVLFDNLKVLSKRAIRQWENNKEIVLT